MNTAEKLKSVAVKVNPPRRSREYWLKMANTDLDGKYTGPPLRGIGRSLRDSAAEGRRYAKNFARMQGLCKDCKHHNARSKAVGGHCKLREQEHCVR